MTQAQRTQTSANGLVPAAVAGLVMAAALTGAILIYGLPTLSLTPGTGTVATNSALIKAEDAWMQQRIAQSSAFGVMSGANRQSADQWEAMQRVLTVSPAARSSTFTEAERMAILRHQMLVPQSAASELDAARKLLIERQVLSGYGVSAWEAAQKLLIQRQVESGVVTHDFTGQRKGGSVTNPWSDTDPRTPTHPQLR
jgi:hypothetical protein